jgi:hypothetical protein
MIRSPGVLVTAEVLESHAVAAIKRRLITIATFIRKALSVLSAWAGRRSKAISSVTLASVSQLAEVEALAPGTMRLC